MFETSSITLIPAPCLLFCLWAGSRPLHAYKPPRFSLPLQACRWTFTLALSGSGRSRTVPVSTAVSRTCTLTTSCRTSPRPRWSPVWCRAASRARSSTVFMASANPMVSRDQCATANQAGAGRTVTSLLSTPVRAASTSAHSKHLSSYKTITTGSFMEQKDLTDVIACHQMRPWKVHPSGRAVVPLWVHGGLPRRAVQPTRGAVQPLPPPLVQTRPLPDLRHRRRILSLRKRIHREPLRRRSVGLTAKARTLETDDDAKRFSFLSFFFFLSFLESECRGEPVRDVYQVQRGYAICQTTRMVSWVECTGVCDAGGCCGSQRMKRRKYTFECSDGTSFSEEVEKTIKCGCVGCM